MSSDIDRVVKQGRLGPVPPSLIGSGIQVLRRAAPYNLEDYQGGVGQVTPPSPTRITEDSPRISREPEEEASPAAYELQMTHNFGQMSSQQSQRALILAYLLTQRLSFSRALQYLHLIFSSGLSFPPPIQKVLLETISKWVSEPDRLEFHFILFGSAGNQLQLFLPRHLLMTPGLPYFFFTSCYWLRVPHFILSVQTLRDLYLVTANPFDRYPARKLLSYYRDPELYLLFGKADRYLFPRIYSTKRQQLDGFVAFALSQFGYYSVQSWSRPLQILLNKPRTTVPLKSEIDRIGVTLEEIMRTPDIRALRLYIQVVSSWPWLKDKEPWIPFLEFGKNLDLNISGESLPLIQSEQVRDQFSPLEENFDLCLVCQTIRPDQDFALCGHPICSTCQVLWGSPKCPFCQEHFICDSLDDSFVERMEGFPKSSIDLEVRVEEIKKEASGREFSFDWANYRQ